VAGKDPEQVLIIGAGQHAQPNAASLAEAQAFNTPLGSAWIDRETAARFEELSARHPDQIVFDDIAHIEEHCIETQLPFVQYLFPEARIIPLLVGPTRQENVERVADCVRDAVGVRFSTTLFVLASNLTSYQDQQHARREGLRLMDCLLQLEWGSLFAAGSAFSLGPAGLSAAAVFVSLLGSNYYGSILCRANSADFSEDPSTTIEYGSICYRVREPAGGGRTGSRV
jgi:hypothetical protein